MKIGKYPVKHSYNISRLVADVLSLGLAVMIVSATVMFFQQYQGFIDQFMLLTDEAMEALKANNPNYEWKQWLALIFPVLTLAVFVVYIVLVCKSHKLERFKATKLTAQKCYDTYAFCVSLCKLPVLVIIINIMCVAHDKLLPVQIYGYEWLSVDTILPIALYGILMAIVIRWTMHRLAKITAKPEKTDSTAVKVKAVAAPKNKDNESGSAAPENKEEQA